MIYVFFFTANHLINMLHNSCVFFYNFFHINMGSKKVRKKKLLFKFKQFNRYGNKEKYCWILNVFKKKIVDIKKLQEVLQTVLN